MKKLRRMLTLPAILLWACALPAVAAEMALIPSHADGPFAVTDNEITIPAGGVRVFLDVYISGWAPALIGTYEANMAKDGTAFAGGGGGSVDFARPACTDGSSSPQCAALFGVPTADANCWNGDSFCVPAYIDWSRTDWVLNAPGVNPLAAVGTSDRWAFGGLDLNHAGVADPGTARYGGTFVIAVSSDATGTFSARLFPEAEGGGTFVLELLARDPLPLTLVPALITIGCSGPCSGDDCDSDGIEDILDDDDGFASNSWSDNITSPVAFGGNIVRLGSEVAICDLPSPGGVQIQNLTGTVAVARSFCPTESMELRELGLGEITQFDCLITGRAARSAPIAQATAVAGDVEVVLINQSVPIATVTLPEGNAVQFIQEALEVLAPATNTLPLTVLNGTRQEELAPGDSTTIADFVSVPAASPWGLLVLALALLTGIAFKAARRRAMQA